MPVLLLVSLYEVTSAPGRGESSHPLSHQRRGGQNASLQDGLRCQPVKTYPEVWDPTDLPWVPEPPHVGWTEVPELPADLLQPQKIPLLKAPASPLTGSVVPLASGSGDSVLSTGESEAVAESVEQMPVPLGTCRPA